MRLRAPPSLPFLLLFVGWAGLDSKADRRPKQITDQRLIRGRTKVIPSDMAKTIASAQIQPEQDEHLKVLAARWSQEHGVAISRSDVIRAFLKAGLERYPVSDNERADLRGGDLVPIRKAPVRVVAPPVEITIANDVVEVRENGGDDGIRTRSCEAA